MDYNQYQNLFNSYQTMNHTCPSTNYIHINHNFVRPHINPVKWTQTNYVMNNIVPNTLNTMLINPNFKQHNVYVNPHFNATNRKILVNPKILNNSATVDSKFSSVTSSSNSEHILNKLSSYNSFPVEREKTNFSIRSQYKIVSINSDSTKSNPSTFNTISNNVVSRKRRTSIRSKYKIVKSSLLKSASVIPRKRRTSIRTKYKIVKSSTSVSVTNKKSSIKNKYKIDRRSVTIQRKTPCKKKVLFNSISDVLRKNVFKYNKKDKSVINKFKLNNNNTRLMNISGVLYKKSQTKLQKLKKTTVLPKPRKINVRRISLISTPNKLLRLLNTSKNKSNSTSSVRKIRQKIQQNKLQKNNIPCPVYRRYGKCRRKEAGRCIFVHNSNQIFLCKKFLQGACVDKDCLLSHKVSLEKMPTCKYYLEGCCTKMDCSYLHVKINPKADICRKFLEGFCNLGRDCNLRHQFLCPDFERVGKCPKRKCMYPHKEKTEINLKTRETSSKSVKEHEKQVVEELDVEKIETARYYLDTKSKDNVKNEGDHIQCFPREENCVDSGEGAYKRPQLGKLPSYIPFD